MDGRGDSDVRMVGDETVVGCCEGALLAYGWGMFEGGFEGSIMDRVWKLAAILTVTIFVRVIAGQSAEIRVCDFGAVPNDGKDDTPAIRAAVEACRGKRGVRLEFGPGRYDFEMANEVNRRGLGAFLTIEGLEGIVIDGKGAELIGKKTARFFHFRDCTDVEVRDLSIDFEPVPFSAGKVLKANSEEKWFDMEVTGERKAEAGIKVEGVLGYDPARMRFEYRGFDWGQWDFKNATKLVGENVVRVFVKYDVPKVGSWVNLRHKVYGGNAFSFLGCKGVRVESVNVYSTPGMGLSGGDCEDIYLKRFNVRIKPGSKRWMSSTADGTHFNSCRGKIVMEDCVFDGIGDDATNIHNAYMLVSKIIDERTAGLVNGKSGGGVPRYVPRAGDELEFGGGENPFVPQAVMKVRSVRVDSDRRMAAVELTEKLPDKIKVGDLVGNASACATVRIRRCKVLRNRARGFLIQTRDVVVEDCEFRDVTGAAVQITSDTDLWWEGIGTRNVTLRNNVMDSCNFGASRRDGVIDIYADIVVAKELAGAGVHRDIVIEGNLIKNADGAGIHVCSADGVVIKKNRIEKATGAAVFVKNSRNVEMAGNRFSDCAGGELDIGDGCENGTIKLRD